MMYHTEAFFKIIFGDKRFQFTPQKFKNLEKTGSLLSYAPFDQVKKTMKVKELVFLHQVHGNDGLIIESSDQASKLSAFSCEGDYLITKTASVGLAVATADCLPIIFYSSFIPVVGIVHAGWRGSVKQIAAAAVKSMQQKFSIKPSDLRVFFGPSAKRCCYKVGAEVVEALDNFSFKDEVLRKIDNDIFFDLPYFNQLLLQEIGVLPSSFQRAYNICTICDKSFCSYRRDKNIYRQMTIVSLK